MSKVTFHDTVSVDVAGTLPAKGSKAPAFSLVNAELGESTLATYAGKRKVLNIFPSVDTGVCATSVRRFNTEASKLDNTVVLCISGDLPLLRCRGPEECRHPFVLPQPGLPQGLRRGHDQRPAGRPDRPCGGGTGRE